MMRRVIWLIVFLLTSGCAALNPNSADDYYYEGLNCAKSKNFDSSIVYFKKAIAEKPDFINAYYMLSTVYYRVGKYAEAINCADQCLKIDKDFTDCMMVKADGYLSAKQYYEAAEAYEIILKYEPNKNNFIYKDKAPVLFGLGIAYGFTEDYSKSLSALTQCRNLKDVNPISKNIISDCRDLYRSLAVEAERKKMKSEKK